MAAFEVTEITPEERSQLRKRADYRYRQGCARSAQIHELAREASTAADANRLHAMGDAEYAKVLREYSVGDPEITRRDLEIIRRGVRV